MLYDTFALGFKKLYMKLLFLFLLFINIMPVAAIPDKGLVVVSSDATSRYSLKSIRRITFNDGLMLVDMKDGSTFSWNTDRVNCVTLGESEPGQESDITGVLQSAVFTVADNVLSVDCCAQTRVQLCACDGKVVYDVVCTGAFSLDMATLPTGVYVLKLDGCTYKIINR